MPKKRSTIFSKPNSPAHPSLSSSSKCISHSLSATAFTPNSVNDRIQKLRLEQNAAGSKAFEAPPYHTVHPSLRAILQVPDVSPPRPRPGLRVTGGRRGPAGPAPPNSWLRQRSTEQREIKDIKRAGRTTIALPGYDLPVPGSLLDLTLKTLARDWDFHLEYDQYYLATLPVRYKELLLHFIALEGSNYMDRSALETVFLDDTELDDATGASDLTHLDLSTSIGRNLSLKDLKSFFTTPPYLNTTETLADTTLETIAVPEDWDAFSIPSTRLPRFTTITHLSLSNPPPTVSWSHLLSLLSQLPQPLTHLSLAFWPLPTLTPNSVTAYTSTPSGTIQAGGSNFYSAFDNDWSESTSILRRVAKATLCLQWLDLTGNWPWMQALGGDGFDWGTLWSALETLVVGQGWVPECFQVEEVEQSSWREEFEIPGVGQVLDGMLKKAGRELWVWVLDEVLGFEFERLVRANISDAIRRGEDAGLWAVEDENGSGDQATASVARDDDWSAAIQGGRRSRMTATARTPGIRFERGWDRLWIREALLEIYAHEQRIVTLRPARGRRMI